MLISPEELLRQAMIDLEEGGGRPDGILLIELTRDEGGGIYYRWRAAKLFATDVMVACDLTKRDALAAIE